LVHVCLCVGVCVFLLLLHLDVAPQPHRKRHTLQHMVMHCNTLHAHTPHTPTHCNTPQHNATQELLKANVSKQHTAHATRCNTLQRALQHTATTHCNTLQHDCYLPDLQTCLHNTLHAATNSTHATAHCNTLEYAATRHCNTRNTLQHHYNLPDVEQMCPDLHHPVVRRTVCVHMCGMTHSRERHVVSIYV